MSFMLIIQGKVDFTSPEKEKKNCYSLPNLLIEFSSELILIEINKLSFLLGIHLTQTIQNKK